jgi:hypothetical protein
LFSERVNVDGGNGIKHKSRRREVTLHCYRLDKIIYQSSYFIF